MKMRTVKGPGSRVDVVFNAEFKRLAVKGMFRQKDADFVIIGNLELLKRIDFDLFKSYVNKTSITNPDGVKKDFRLEVFKARYVGHDREQAIQKCLDLFKRYDINGGVK